MELILLFVVIGSLLVFVAFLGERRVPWATKLRRVRPGVAEHAIWQAPQHVLTTVTDHYLEAVRWLQDVALAPGASQNASRYLCGEMLEQYKRYSAGQDRRFAGILRAQHGVSVHSFSEDGATCLLLDALRNCRMATYDTRDGHRVATQLLENATVVYQMRYDLADGRWKLERFVQALPPVPQNTTPRVHLQTRLGRPIGRDN